MTGNRERRVIFGEVADTYDASRPGYPDQLFAEVLDYARLDGAPVVEVGAGTGKASLALAARNLSLTCVEPDPRMAAVLDTRLGTTPRTAAPRTAVPGTTVFIGGFEQWQPGSEPFGLVFSATAWHWVDPEIRWTKAVEVLRPGGAIALCWNVFRIPDDDAYAALAQAHTRHGVPKLLLDTDNAVTPYDDDLSDAWPMAQLLADDRYVDVESRQYAARDSLATERFLGLLTSLSRYRVLPEEQRDALFADIGAAVDGLGGHIDLTIQTRLFLARTHD
jgi:SAM-dependent methyltransferase